MPIMAIETPETAATNVIGKGSGSGLAMLKVTFLETRLPAVSQTYSVRLCPVEGKSVNVVFPYKVEFFCPSKLYLISEGFSLIVKLSWISGELYVSFMGEKIEISGGVVSTVKFITEVVVM